ncbi:MAG TPA: PilT/PilU family type 4a pilus ATPase [Candidatus Brocadiia bacterium]|nr:PilT/PilU family type 4a pilus ATPase [Candidatus Brocadiia bacterium]
MLKLRDLLLGMIQAKASDLFLRAGRPVSVRVHGEVRWVGGGRERTAVDAAYVAEALRTVLNEREWQRFERTGEADGAYQEEGVGRFRVNAYRQRGEAALAFRHIPLRIPGLDELNLPAEPLRKLCGLKRGLVLVTGAAGSGKSTCLAAMLDFINQGSARHIVTVEDPVEFIHEDKLCAIDQREVGLDTETFGAALRHVLRQSPDVILIGEMRDQVTMEAALNAAETGHLVLSTLHTATAVQTLERIMAYFPPHQHALVRAQLAMVLEGIISLRLIPRRDGQGRVPAVELLVATARTRELLQEGKTRELADAMRDGDFYAMRTFDQSLLMLVAEGQITEDAALAAADNPDEFKLRRRGFRRGGSFQTQG